MAAMPMTLTPVSAWRPCAFAQLLRVPSPGLLRRGAPQRMPLSRGRSAGLLPGVHETSNKGTLHFFRLFDDAGRHGPNVKPSVVGLFHRFALASNACIAAQEEREMSPISRERRMSFTTEAADLLGVIAGKGSQKERQLRAWRRLVSEFPHSTWSFNRVHDLFTQDQRARVRAQEIEELRAIARAARDQITLARTEYDALRDRIERCERAISRPHSHNRRPTTHQLREIVPVVGGDDGPVDL